MSSSKIGYQVAASMDKILNTKVLSKFAKSTKEKECDCKKDCDCDCKVEKKISKKADAVLYLIKSSETLDKLGLHKIASDLLISAAGLLDDPEKDRMQKENEIVSKMESEKDPQLFRDLAEAEIRSKLLSKDEEKDEESFNLEPSVIEALEKTEMFSDEELAQLKKLHEESNEDESLSWDVDDGDLVDNLDLDTSMAWDDEYEDEDKDEELDNEFWADHYGEEGDDLEHQFNKKFELSEKDEDLEDESSEEDLEEDSEKELDEELDEDSEEKLDEELDDLYNQFSSRQTDYDDEVSDELSEEDEEDFDL
jgi:hypothetical protein